MNINGIVYVISILYIIISCHKSYEESTILYNATSKLKPSDPTISNSNKKWCSLNDLDHLAEEIHTCSIQILQQERVLPYFISNIRLLDGTMQRKVNDTHAAYAFTIRSPFLIIQYPMYITFGILWVCTYCPACGNVYRNVCVCSFCRVSPSIDHLQKPPRESGLSALTCRNFGIIAHPDFQEIIGQIWQMCSRLIYEKHGEKKERNMKSRENV